MDASYQPAGGEWEDPNTLNYEQDLAARGDVEAHRQLGYRMLTGQGLPRDLPGAFRQFQAAARGGDPYALFNLGYMHIRGLHAAQNFTAARERFLEAAAKDLPAALNGLGAQQQALAPAPASLSFSSLLLSPQHWPPLFRACSPHRSTAPVRPPSAPAPCRRGVLTCSLHRRTAPCTAPSCTVGVLYFHGQGVPINYTESLRYFQLAAGQDHDATYNLGTMYQASLAGGQAGRQAGRGGLVSIGAQPLAC